MQVIVGQVVNGQTYAIQFTASQKGKFIMRKYKLFKASEVSGHKLQKLVGALPHFLLGTLSG